MGFWQDLNGDSVSMQVVSRPPCSLPTWPQGNTHTLLPVASITLALYFVYVFSYRQIWTTIWMWLHVFHCYAPQGRMWVRTDEDGGRLCGKQVSSNWWWLCHVTTSCDLMQLLPAVRLWVLTIVSVELLLPVKNVEVVNCQAGYWLVQTWSFTVDAPARWADEDQPVSQNIWFFKPLPSPNNWFVELFLCVNVIMKH